jgi:hypothetical protein
MPRMGVRYPNAAIASRLLDEDVTDWINGRRAAGHTWRSIRDELARATDGVIDVVHETVRAWAKIRDGAAA